MKLRALRLALVLPLACASLTGCDDEGFVCDGDSSTCLEEAAQAIVDTACSCAIDQYSEVSSMDECVDQYFGGGLPTNTQACLADLEGQSAAAAEAVECAAASFGGGASCVQRSACNLIRAGVCIQSIPAGLDACAIDDELLAAITECTGGLGAGGGAGEDDAATDLAEAAQAMIDSTCVCVIDLDPDLETADACIDAYFNGGLAVDAESCLRDLITGSEAAAAAVECSAGAFAASASCVDESACNLIQLAGCTQAFAEELDACAIDEALLADINACTGDLGL